MISSQTVFLRASLTSIIITSTAVSAQEFDTRELGAGYAHLVSVVAQPEIAISGVEVDIDEPGIDSVELVGLHIPYYREFDLEGKDIDWYLQGSVGYAEYSQEGRIEPIPGLPVRLESDWTAYNGVLEVGLVFPLGAGFSIATGISGGIARLENDFSFSERFYEELFRPAFDGKLYNWETNTALYRLHSALRYDREHHGYRIKGTAHLTYSYVDSFGESSDFAGFSDDSGAAIIQLDVSRRVNDPDSDRPVFLIGHLGSTSFLGSNRNELGFDQYFEAGISLGIDRYAAGLLYIFGEDVDGLSLTFNYDY